MRERMFQRALDLDPKCADAMNQLGLLAAASRTIWRARGAGSSRRSKRSRIIPARSTISRVLYAKIGPAQRCHRGFPLRHQMNPDDDELYLNLARIYVMMGERDKARAVLGELMERKPGNATATKALARTGGQMIPSHRSADRSDCAIGTRGEHQRVAVGAAVAPDADRARSAAGIELPLFRCQRPGPLRQPGIDDGRCRPLSMRSANRLLTRAAPIRATTVRERHSEYEGVL